MALPHDWLTWRLRGFGPKGSSALGPIFEELVTDRSDASGAGYFNSIRNEYETDLLESALGKPAVLPRVLGANQAAGVDSGGRLFAAGAGDNAGAALGLGIEEGDIVVSIGTSGTVFSSSAAPVSDLSGTVACFADAGNQYLPIAVTLNAARVLKSASDLLDVDFDELSRLALSAKPGSGGVVLVPYFEGERTPNLPNARASIHNLSIENSTRENLARAFFEGMLCGLADGMDALVRGGVRAKRILLIGGGAQSIAVQKIASTIFGLPIVVPKVSEYVAEGAAVQAAWVLTGSRPKWVRAVEAEYDAVTYDIVREQYRSITSSNQG